MASVVILSVFTLGTFSLTTWALSRGRPSSSRRLNPLNDGYLSMIFHSFIVLSVRKTNDVYTIPILHMEYIFNFALPHSPAGHNNAHHT